MTNEEFIRKLVAEAHLAGWRAARDTILEIVKGYTRVPASHGAEPLPVDKEAALFVGLTMCEEIRELPEPCAEPSQEDKR